MPFNRMRVPAERLDQVPAFLVDQVTDKPVPGARLIVEASPKPVVFESDDAGQVLIQVDSALLRDNPPLRVEPDGVSFTMSVTVMMNSTRSAHGRVMSVQLRSVSGLKKFGDSRVAVFHQAGNEILARKAHAELVRCRAGVKSVLGLEPERMAVVLEPTRQEKDVIYLTVSAPGYDSTWLCFEEKWDSGEFMRTAAHEWAESTVESSLSLYDDPRNRFVGDGLAEFVKWKLYGLPEDYRDRLSPAQIGDVDTVNLLSEFQVVPGSVFHRRKLGYGIGEHLYPPGYALSFAFWHELSEKYGPRLLSKFVERMAQQRSASADDVIEILVQLTGDEAVGDRVRSADVEAARSRIERLIQRGDSQVSEAYVPRTRPFPAVRASRSVGRRLSSGERRGRVERGARRGDISRHSLI